MIRILFFVTLGLPFGHTPAALADEHSPASLTFGVVPQQASEKLARDWVPVMALLSEHLGRRIRFATAPTIPEFERRLDAGAYDIAYMNPYHFIKAHQKPGYRALARQSNHQLRGIIVVSRDLTVESVAELAGQKVAFPAPKAFAATLITRSYLNQEAPGYTATYVNSHDSVYRSVADGLFAAGGGIVRTFRETEPEIRSKLEILWLSPGYTSHAIATHPDLSEGLRAQLMDALLALSSDETGKKLLKALGMSGFEAANNVDWDDVRSLDLGDL